MAGEVVEAACGVTNLGALDPSVVLKQRLAACGKGDPSVAANPTPGEGGGLDRVAVSIES